MKKTRIWKELCPFAAAGLLLALCACASGPYASDTPAGPAAGIREPAIAGTWYPDSPDVLRRQIQTYLDNVPDKSAQGELAALIVPHAGYVYSGQIAAHAYKLLGKRKFSTVVVIGPSHYVAFEGVATYEGTGFRTPLGVVPIDNEFIAALEKKNAAIRHLPEVHAKEHSVEIQLPFLQVLMPGFKLVPLVMGEQDFPACRALADALADCVRGKSVLIVASSDLSHYHPYEKARSMDAVVVRDVESFDPQGLSYSLAVGECEACGGGPIVAAMLAAARLGANSAQVLHAANSGGRHGQEGRDRKVWSATWRPLSGRKRRLEACPRRMQKKKTALPGLTAEEKALLHRIARESVEGRLQRLEALEGLRTHSSSERISRRFRNPQ